MAELSVAVAGAGYFAREHLRAWAAHPEACLLAVVDRDVGRAQAAASEFGGAALATIEDALALGPDLVDLALPPEAHLPAIELCMAARVPTICQKPFCGGLEGARRATAMAEAAGTALIVHENFRWQPWWRRIRAEIDAGRIGTPHQVTFRLRPGDGRGPDAYLDRQPYFRAMPRLLVHETAVHLIDVFRFILGEPEWVWADLRRRNPRIAGEDAAILVLGFPGGRRGLFDGDRLADHPARDPRRVMGEGLVEGSGGALTLDGDGRLAIRDHGAERAEPIPLEVGEGFGGGCVGALQAHVVDHLLRGADLENPAEAYLRTLEVVEAAYASHAEGRRVPLDAGTEGTT